MVIRVWNNMYPKAFFCLLSFQRLWGPEEFRHRYRIWRQCNCFSCAFVSSFNLKLLSIVRLVELQWWPWPVDLWMCPLFPPFSSVLFNEVRYVHTPAELLRVESAARQNSDIVVGHIPVLGLPGTISIFSIVHCLGWNEAILYISCFLFLWG